MLDIFLRHDLGDQVHGLFDHRRQVFQFVAEGPGLLLGPALAHAEMQPALGQNVERGDALGHLHRMVHCRRQADDAMPDLQPLGLAGEIGQECLRRAHMRILGQGRMLDRPDDIEADLLGQQALIDDIVEHPEFGLRIGQDGLRLVDDGKLHGSPCPLSLEWALPYEWPLSFI